MKEFVEFIAKHLVDNPDNVSIEEANPNEKTIELTLKVGADDVGKVIGKQGKSWWDVLNAQLGATATFHFQMPPTETLADAPE